MDIIEAVRNADRELAECARREAEAWAVCIAELNALQARIENGEFECS
jgi:hypothetical protein